MNSIAIQIQDRGVVTLPKELRQLWGLAKGDFLNVTVDTDTQSATMRRAQLVDAEVVQASQKALKELRAGKSSGAFVTMDDFEKSLGL